jgi:photosystem II stability/assembly factor-like uncharacterized protein
MKRLIILLFVMSSTLFPQWNHVDVSPLSGSIYEFYMIDSLNIVAGFSGDSQNIIRSRDGGKTWEFMYIIPPGYSSQLNFVDSLNIFTYALTGAPNRLSKTTDGGASWNDISLPVSVLDVDQVKFVSPAIGYVFVVQQTTAGNKSRVLKTTNGGIDWAPLDTTISKIYWTQFDDINNGWIFSDSVYRTTDGGASFSVFPTPQGISYVRSVDILGNNIALGGYRNYTIPPYYNSYIIQTALSSDGGSTWSVKDHGDKTVEGYPLKIKFIDPNTVVVLRYLKTGVLYTTDRGLTWSTGNSPENLYGYGDFQILNGKVYMAGGGAIFVVSGPDISAPWDLRLTAAFTQFMTADFTTAGLAIAFASGGRVYISRDKGKTWTMKITSMAVPTSVFIVGDSTVYITDLYRLYKTDDLFSSFDTIAHFPDGYITDVRIRNNGEIWLCNSKSILSSSDNGQSWVTRYTSPGLYIYSDLEIFDNGTAYAVNGEVLKTTDNGISWVNLNLPIPTATEIEFYDSKNGFIGNPGEAFYKTTDGGMSFLKLLIPGMSSPQKIYCQDSLNFMLSANELYSTYDGGWLWKVNEFATQPFNKTFKWMYLFDHFDGIVLGSGKETLFITSNRGNTPVELSLFSALPFGNKVVLQWTTETETNNMGFEIERRDKYGDWKKIAFSKGSGTSTHKIYYGYDDYEPKAPAILYYRLKQIDYNGEFEYSNEVEVLLGEIPENYSIQQNYPNPFNPSTKVTFLLPEENKVVIKVFNAMGEQVKEIDRGVLSHGYFEQDLEMGTESSGMYFCQVLCTNTISGRTKSLTVKMVLMK